MIIWNKTFQVYRSLPSFPHPNHIAEEIQYDSSYFCESRLRTSNSLLFVYTIKGQGAFRVKETEYNLLPETAFLCRDADENIAWYYPEKATKPWQFLWLNFQGMTADAMIQDLHTRHGHIYQIPFQHPIFREMYAFRQRPEKICDITPAAGATLIVNILACIADIANSEKTSFTQNILVKNAQSLMIKQLETQLKIADFAKQLTVSREHLTRVFKIQTNTSPAEYLLKHKILRACTLLKESNLSSKEIAEKLGYNNATNFSRAFKKMQNITPQGFRKTGAMPVY